MIEKYLNNNLINPRYLFHGSSLYLEEIEQRKSVDANGNEENIDYAVFLTSSFIIASAYAFMHQIQKSSEGLNWSFEIGGNASTGEINIIFSDVNIPLDLEGYIYVFDYDESYEHSSKSSIQYKCHNNIKPIDVVKINFEDFKDYYNIHEHLAIKNKL